TLLFTATQPHDIYTLSLHDALPISASVNKVLTVTKTFLGWARRRSWLPHLNTDSILDNLRPVKMPIKAIDFLQPKQVGKLLEARSEEHTSELQSRENLVCRLLLEKK